MSDSTLAGDPDPNGMPRLDRDRAVARMLAARSIAVVGASPRAGSFGERMTMEVLRSPARPKVHLVHPTHRDILGERCVPSLADVPAPVDAVLLGVGDDAVPGQLELAGARGDAGVVIYGSAHGLGGTVSEIASSHGTAVCGAGCMGFVNVSEGVRAIGYLERFPIPLGPIALVTHSGSVFSALLRTHRRLGFSLAVSSGQEVVTTTADYLHYALTLPETRVVALVLETLRDAARLRSALVQAADRDVPVVALTVGGSPTGRTMVTAHSGALAGDDAAWEALFAAYGVHRVLDLDEMADTLELFAIGRRAPRTSPGVATLHDSGAERALVADIAHSEQIAFARLQPATERALEPLLDPGLAPTNPLDVWGRGADAERIFTECLTLMAEDPGVGVVCLAVDLVEEYDGDESYPHAMTALLGRTDKPIAVLTNVVSAVDQAAAAELRASGIPVLEGTRSGLRAIRHLLDHSRPRPALPPQQVEPERRRRWIQRLRLGPLSTRESLALVSDYGIDVPATIEASSLGGVLAASKQVGFPLVLKVDDAGLLHKTDVGGVVTGLADDDALTDAYQRMASSLGPDVVLQPQVASGTEIVLGIVRDPLIGALLVFGCGGDLVEVIAERVVVLPPVTASRAEELVDRLPLGRLLAGVRGRPVLDRQGVLRAVESVSQLAIELGEALEELDINPLMVSPGGAVAVDALVVPRRTSGMVS